MNLRDQLLKAGVVNKKQADQAARDVRKQQRVEEGSKEAKRILEERERARLEAERAAALEARTQRRRDAEARARAEAVVLQCRHLLHAHRVRMRAGPQPFWFRSPDGREAWKLWLPERVAEDLRCGKLAVAVIDKLDPEIVVVDRETADRVEALRPELVLFRNRGRPDPDPAEQLYDA